MSIRVALHHQTRYQYSAPVTLSPHVVRLRPAPHTRTPIHEYSLVIEPGDHYLNWQQDPHGNHLARAVFPEPSDHLTVTIDLVLDLVSFNPFDFYLEEACEHMPFAYPDEVTQDLAPFLITDADDEDVDDLVAALPTKKMRTVDFLVEATQIVRDRVDYVIRMEPGVQDPGETLRLGKGSCRDSAWLLCQALRRRGLASRFVSGYLVQLVPDRPAVDGPKGTEVDFTDLHAWCEVYVPGAGWIGLDATSGLLAAEGHVPVACAPEPLSAAPITGGFSSTEEVDSDFDVTMTVTRIVDRPRPEKPYPEATWQAIRQCGELVDRTLTRANLELTVGGEPTLVAEGDRDADEWTIAALGPTKWAAGDRIARRLLAKWAPGGLLAHGQGKWYPGEELPRWAIGIHWRTDGKPLWRDLKRLATVSAPPYRPGRVAPPVGPIKPAKGVVIRPVRAEPTDGDTAAAAFADALCAELAVPREHAMPAFEDAWYQLWHERRLPEGVDPLDERLGSDDERARLARLLDDDTRQQPVAWVLPLRPVSDGWQSSSWHMRNNRCYLAPGDSPAGFRLPLDRLPWGLPEDDDAGIQLDPSGGYPPLPTRWPKRKPTKRPLPQASDGGPGVIRTALVIEVRDGQLRIFLPPVVDPARWCELLHRIERAAATSRTTVLLEGYPAPSDPRLGEFKVTPDPGVLEINVPPVSSWQAQIEQSESLYQIAREEGLAADTFLIDGRQVGTGGGAHLVLGGPEPLRSPFLRDPSLLASLLRWMHNHPSLTYAFAGLFIGPTSQAPRADEGRTDFVHQLEMALRLVEQLPPDAPLWQVDRLLRNCLVDLTGNTHRTAICIDKLYSPDGSAGRLGLVEFRCFEMPPHEHMALAQGLLIRAAVAAFARTPYRRQLTTWGSALHDRFMTHAACQQDLVLALDELSSRGQVLDPEWFEPHLEFRFPVAGHIDHAGIRLELRIAIEPWHVLGEEAGAGGQARYVDSSCERLQVRVAGLYGDRYAVGVNGWQVPLQATGIPGEWVGAVRYRAWHPPSCLHPTLGLDSPLHIGLHDTWNERAVAGCTWHVMHPGGRAYDIRPINREAAEGRCAERFQPWGHPPGSAPLKVAPPNPSWPHTLDLLWARASQGAYS